MREEIEKRRAEAAEKKKQMEEGPPKPAFAITPKGSSKVSFCGEVQKSPGMFSRILSLLMPVWLLMKPYRQLRCYFLRVLYICNQTDFFIFFCDTHPMCLFREKSQLVTLDNPQSLLTSLIRTTLTQQIEKIYIPAVERDAIIVVPN